MSTIKTVTDNSRIVPAVMMAGLVVTALGACWLAYGPDELFSAPPALNYKTAQTNGAPQIGGPFTLTDDTGKAVTEASLVGDKYHLIFFGFANCPDVCPGMLQLMAGVEEKLPAAVRDKLQFVFVSVDPARDTLKKLGAYVDSFSPRFVGWTGDKTQIDRMVKGYLAYYSKRPGEDGVEYTVDHSGFAYLMGRNGKYVAHFRSSDSASSLLEGLTDKIK
jgi:cytochrome oxidase Cu insertion factor (SCO1/SenC/PrrC family)